MGTSTITLEIPESRIKSVVGELRESIKADCGTEYSEPKIRNAVVEMLESRLDLFLEDAVERLTSPSFEEARDFARILDETDRVPLPAPPVLSLVPEKSVFTGYRAFSLEKMAAMMSYIAHRTTDLYKTKLNKLLFYADFVNDHFHGTSISGSKYIHLPYGPVPDGYEETLETLNHYGVINVSKQDSADLVLSSESPACDFLTAEERRSLDWVLESYGGMSASQLTEISHREKAYKNTHSGEQIAYEYAKFLTKLPSEQHSNASGKSY